ncbi:MAG: YjbH domain-containing protein [Bacteroidota bacterium]
MNDNCTGKIPRYLILILLQVFILAEFGNAQIIAGSDGDIEPRFLIDKPTAGMLKRGSFGMNLDFFQQGGLVVNLNAGVMNRLSFGVSYGGNNIVGSNKIDWNKSAGVNIKFRLFDETATVPAIALGFDSQGKENYVATLNRYAVKSSGFFIVGSKNLELLGFLSVHAGLNRSLENSDRDNDINTFLGIEKTIGSDLSFVAEYDFAVNDSKKSILTEHRTFFHTGFRWSFGNGFAAGINLKDIQTQKFSIGSRTMFVEYINIF